MSPRATLNLSWITLVLCAFLSATVHAQTEPVQRSAHLLNSDPAPVPANVSTASSGEIRARRLVVTMLVGALSATVVGLATGMTTCVVETLLSSDPMCIAPYALFAPLGAVAGGFAGAVIASSYMNSRGNLWAALGASALGLVVGGLAAVVTGGYGLPLVAVLPGVFAALAYEATSVDVHPTMLPGGGGLAVSGYF